MGVGVGVGLCGYVCVFVCVHEVCGCVGVWVCMREHTSMPNIKKVYKSGLSSYPLTYTDFNSCVPVIRV